MCRKHTQLVGGPVTSDCFERFSDHNVPGYKTKTCAGSGKEVQPEDVTDEAEPVALVKRSDVLVIVAQHYYFEADGMCVCGWKLETPGMLGSADFLDHLAAMIVPDLPPGFDEMNAAVRARKEREAESAP